MNIHQDRPSPRPRHPLTLALGIVLLIPAVPLAILGIVAITSGLTTNYEWITPLTIGAASLAEAALFATAAGSRSRGSVIPLAGW